MLFLSPRDENEITQAKDLTEHKGITPQLDTRAKQSRLDEQLLVVVAAEVLHPTSWFSRQRVRPGRWGGTDSQHHLSSPWGPCAMAEMNAASSAER